MSDSYTENIADFGSRERCVLIELLEAWREQGLPEGFSENQVRPAMNTNSGCVFLTNSDMEVAMLNGDKLEQFHTLPDSGTEGFLSDILTENSPDDLSRDDIDYLVRAVKGCGVDGFGPPECWSDYFNGLELQDAFMKTLGKRRV